jgi:hypothetical protein
VCKCVRLKVYERDVCCVSTAPETLAFLCEMPKSHDLGRGRGRGHVIRISKLPKITKIYCVRPAVPQNALRGHFSSHRDLFGLHIRLYTRDKNHTWKIDTLPWDVFHQASKKRFYYSLVSSLDPELLDAIYRMQRPCRRTLKRNESGPPSVTPLTKFPKLPLLLVDMQQPRSTAAQEKCWRMSRTRLPGVYRAS